MNQMVIPVFYELDPSHVKKQTGEFGKAFDKTCEGKTEDEKQRWVRALAEIATMAGYDSRNWTDDSKMIEEISKDVLKKLLLTPSDDFRDFVGIEAHIEEIMDSKLCLESGGVRMVGILGPSGIGKSTIARALYNRLSSTQFDHRTFASYKRAIENRKVPDVNVKLVWAQQFLSEILCQKDIKIESSGVVEQRLKHRKVLMVLDDVDEIELLETLVGQTGWFGSGSRIIVVTQDKALLKKHEIDLIYEVQFPSQDLALQMLCQSAFRQTSPTGGFTWLAAEVVKIAGNLPLGLNVLGSSLRGKDEEHWLKMMTRFRNRLNGDIEKTLRICYDGLSEKDDQDIFVYIACLFNGESVNYINNLLEKIFDTSVDNSLRTLADKSLARITTQDETVQMHILLEKLGREIVRAESINNPGKRRFLVDPKDISDVFNDNTGTKNVLGIRLDRSEIYKPLFIDEKSFEGMCNLRFIKFYKERWGHTLGLNLPRGLLYLPSKLILLHWDDYPAKYLPSSFSAEYLVELIMKDSKLEKLWEGIDQPLRSVKVMNLSGSEDLKEIPDLSNATSLEILNLCNYTSLVTLPSSFRNLKKLIDLRMERCSKLEVLPADVNLESLDYLDLSGCSRLRNFPRISRNISWLYLDGTAMEEEDCLWIENLSGLIELVWENCPLRCMPPNFHPEHLVQLAMIDSKLEKLWEGVQSLTNLTSMDLSNCGSLKEIPDLSTATCLSELYLSGCKRLKEIPDLSNATNLLELDLSECETLKEIPDLSNATSLELLNLSNCTSLVKLPSSIRNLKKLVKLCMARCSNLEVLPSDVDLGSLDYLDLRGCSRLRNFPRISRNISWLCLDGTAMEEEDCFWIENLSGLTYLVWINCPLRCMPPNFHPEHLTVLVMRDSKLEKLWEGVKSLTNLILMDLSNCGSLKEIPDLSKAINLEILYLSECESLKEILDLSNAIHLRDMNLSGCKSLTEIPDLSKAINLEILILLGCESLKEIPDLPKATKLKKLNLENCASLKKLPDSVRNLEELRTLILSGCTNLEDLPRNINLVSLTTLNLSGCSRLTSFPQISTSITYLILNNTAIEEVPSWIENIVALTHLEMRECEKLKIISANICNLKHLNYVDFTDCGGVTSVSDASLVKTVAELHEETYLSCSDSNTQFLFRNCFNLDQDAQKFIIQSDFRYAVLPGKEVPTYFIYRTRGSCLTVPLPQSSLSQNHLGFTACFIPNPVPATDFKYYYENIGMVHWKFRGAKGEHNVFLAMDSAEMAHLGVFHFNIFFQDLLSGSTGLRKCGICVQIPFHFRSWLHKRMGCSSLG